MSDGDEKEKIRVPIGVNYLHNQDINVNKEIIIALLSNQDLLGFYISLLWLNQMGLLKELTQEQIAEFMGLSRPTFTSRKKELIRHKLLIERHSIKEQKNELVLKSFTGVKNFYIGNNPEETLKILLQLSKTLKKSAKKPVDEVLSLSNITIYNISNTNNKLKYIDKDQLNKIGKVKRFPNSDYEKLIKAYAFLKEIKLEGPERTRLKRPIRNMFLSGYSVKQIFECMKWFRVMESRRGFEWTQNWTMGTVSKKMAEFVAGKLPKPREREVYERIE